MNNADRRDFASLIAGVYAYYRQDLSPEVTGMWWRGLERFDIEQVRRAMDRHTQDPENGRFCPKIADVVKVLEGTGTERAALAWGKTLEAMQSVGAYRDVVFDDPAIMAAVEDAGGWPKLCRTLTDDLGHVQHRFTQAHRAYTGRGSFPYPRQLGGDRSPDSDYEKKGLEPPKPALIGDPWKCRQVFEGGSATGKTAITFAEVAFAALPKP